LSGSEEGASLEATGTVGDVVGEEGVAEVVEVEEVRERKRKSKIKIGRGGSVDCGYEWEGGVAELGEAGFEPSSEVGGVFEFAVLPGCFQAVGVSEAAGRKGGVGELPQEPRVVGGLNIERPTPNVQRRRGRKSRTRKRKRMRKISMVHRNIRAQVRRGNSVGRVGESVRVRR
jgi:hypothetical protein